MRMLEGVWLYIKRWARGRGYNISYSSPHREKFCSNRFLVGMYIYVSAGDRRFRIYMGRYIIDRLN